MTWLRSLALCGCLLLLLSPTRVHAAPPSQTWSCEVSGLISQFPLYIPSLPYVGDTQVTIDGQVLTLRICAPENQSVTAAHLLAVLKDALPKLNAYAGLSLGGGAFHRQIVIAPDDELPSGVDGGVDTDGVIHLWRGSAETTVVHEGAHYWANEQNFTDLWMIEGYAEYLTEQVTGTRRPIALANGRCDGVALANWRYEPPQTIVCGYVVGPAIFRDLAQAIGAAQLRDALRQLRAEGGPIDSWRLLIGLERISGRSLTSIFRARVFPPEQNPWLDQRDALRRRIEQAESLSVHSDIKLPVSLREAFDAGGFAAAAGLLDQLEPSLELIGTIEGSCGRLALSCDRYWRPLPETTRDLAALLLRLRESHDFLGRYAVLHDSARALGIGIPAELTQAAAALQPTDVVRQANVSLLYGQVLEKRCTEHQIACMRWRELWSNNQIAVADSLMQGVTTMLDRAAGLEQAYTGTGWPCGRAWRAFFERSGDPQKTIKFIADAQAAKPELALAASIVAPSSGIARRLLAPILGLDAATLLDSARLAFAEGDLARALTLAQEARAAQLAGVSHGAWLPWPIGGALIGLGVLLAGIVVARKRRRARAQDAHDRLLADLLKQPPGKDGKKGD